MTPTEDAVVVPIAGDPLLVGALLLRVMAQLDDAGGSPAAPAAQDHRFHCRAGPH